jgi:hypothetical protein
MRFPGDQATSNRPNCKGPIGFTGTESLRNHFANDSAAHVVLVACRALHSGACESRVTNHYTEPFGSGTSLPSAVARAIW